MSNILLSSLMGLMFLSVIPAASYAQAVSVNEPEEETQLIENDEGYGKDDTEYYSSEKDTEPVMEEGPNTSDDEAVKDEAAADEADQGAGDEDLADEPAGAVKK